VRARSFDGALEALALIETTASSEELDLGLIREVIGSSPPSGGNSHQNRPQFQNARVLSPRFIESRLQNLLDWLHGDSGRGCFRGQWPLVSRFLEIAPSSAGTFGPRTCS
jgi:hypothetical protein